MIRQIWVTLLYRNCISKLNFFFFLSLGLSLFQRKTYSWEADTLHKHAHLVKKIFPSEKSFIWKFSSSPCTNLAREIKNDQAREAESPSSFCHLPFPWAVWERGGQGVTLMHSAAGLEQGMLQRCKPDNKPDHRKLKHDFAMHKLLMK